VTLIMTSNAGAREMMNLGIGFGSGRAGDGRKEIERLFSPEFRNRLDEIVGFDSLGPDVMERVVDKFIAEVEEQLRERKVKLALTPAARTWLATKGYDPNFGARPMARVIQTELTDRLVDDVLFGELERGGRVEVDLGPDDRLAFRIEA
jgi:ATP-dependent Clp protease ATP-binding subunit ClpA